MNAEWKKFLEKLKKDKNPLYELLGESQLEEKGNELILYLPTPEQQAEVQSKSGKIRAKLSKFSSYLGNKRLSIEVGRIASSTSENSSLSRGRTRNRRNSRQMGNPLQVLNQILDKEAALNEAVRADRTCTILYQQLTERTTSIADDVLSATFPWRLRVGGPRGFEELLLPAFHPVYGVPYVPASSLKGAIRAWARQHQQSTDRIDRLLGTLDGGVGCVQILDAFPTRPCLSVDIANPQWSWESNGESDRVRYQPVPHTLLSMESPELTIGLVRTQRGRRENQPDDLRTVKEWLEKALAAGIGSRVSAGYGRTQIDADAGLPFSSRHPFQMWTQGMYAASTQNPEFRPVALRGMLRYWFRAMAIGLYDTQTCKDLEKQLFGDLSCEGSLRIGVELDEEDGDRPCYYSGTILLEARSQPVLTLIEKLLHLASHLTGVGRGSRRPLHWNNGRMRGCHWELDNFCLGCDRQAWQTFLGEVRAAFEAVRSVDSDRGTPASGHPGDDRRRYQDVLNANARIYLVPSPRMKHSSEVEDWASEGHQSPVLGEALDLLYGDDKFKGQNREGRGNPLVGGTLGIPSFVVIQSNFPDRGRPYQAVTIFGANHPQRQAFIRELTADGMGSIRVF